MKRIFFLLLLVSQFSASKGQEKYSYDFEKLEVVDTIYIKSHIDTLLPESKFVSNNFFINEDQPQITLIKKSNSYWLVYLLPFESGTNSFYSIIGESEDRKYFFVKTQSNNISRGTENIDKAFYIIDVINNSYTSLENYTFSHGWEFGEKGELVRDDHSIKNSEIVVNKNNFIVLNSCFDHFELVECDNLGGEYELQNQKLKKIKSYDRKTMQLKPIQYVGDIAIGMTFEDIRLLYSNVRFEEVPNKYGTCADDDVNGFKIWNENNELMMLVIMNGEMPSRIKYIVVTSSKYNFNNINTNLTIEEAFKAYPKANFRLDALTEWEHLFIQELNIELVFETQENNRIGIYKNEEFLKLKRKKAKIDFIRAE